MSQSDIQRFNRELFVLLLLQQININWKIDIDSGVTRYLCLCDNGIFPILELNYQSAREKLIDLGCDFTAENDVHHTRLKNLQLGGRL